MKVGDIMVTNVISFKPNDRVADVIETLRKHRISGAPVVDEDGKVVGVISEADIVKLNSLIELPEIEINPFNPFSFLEIHNYWKKVGKIPEKIKKRQETLTNGSVNDVMSKKPVTISPEASISEAARIMRKKDFNRLPVVDKQGKLIGIVARQDIIRVLARA
ncbi:MAG: CBS domain-containing protein [Archaeoglobus sp.]|nr:CBS domain-containing protein [Archaeoglobus sp.]